MDSLGVDIGLPEEFIGVRGTEFGHEPAFKVGEVVRSHIDEALIVAAAQPVERLWRNPVRFEDLIADFTGSPASPVQR
ncbi:hypothetical protein [Salinactinospora qingdaonensis]|uniref:Uncharacterized protein n=1 Tax=Salinactinospora qingdaonensis TaxID=702744 RepID=A0ABP7G9R8_9ACTN